MRDGFKPCVVILHGKAFDHMEKDGIIYPLDYQGPVLDRNKVLAEASEWLSDDSTR